MDGAGQTVSTNADIGADEFRDLMARWVTGVAVVTSTANGRPVGCTVNALAAVSLTPPLLLVSLMTVSNTLTAIRDQGTFAVNMLALGQRQLGHHFSTSSRDDRFAAVDHVWVDDVPVLVGAMTSVLCTVAHYFAVADHVLVVGEALRQIDNPDHAPAVFFQRSYWQLSQPRSAQG
jgi:3-hydroxy-9,10-secoandrosta-1,3,5(10)-triene-9,17-dione monooxygenase reductase component